MISIMKIITENKFFFLTIIFAESNNFLTFSFKSVIKEQVHTYKDCDNFFCGFIKEASYENISLGELCITCAYFISHKQEMLLLIIF